MNGKIHFIRRNFEVLIETVVTCFRQVDKQSTVYSWAISNRSLKKSSGGVLIN